MKARNETKADDDMQAGYDFRGGQRGKYAKAFAEGSNVIILEDDVAAVFRDAAAVNEALRGLIRVSRSIGRRAPRRADKAR